MNSKLSVQKIEKHKIRILSYDGGLKDNENYMSGETLWVRGVARGWKDGGWPVCKALKVNAASLNLIRHSIGSQWSCLRSSLEDSKDMRECWLKTTQAAACWICWRRAMCLSEVPYKMEFNWSMREEISADATERAMVSSNDERICLKERIW